MCARRFLILVFLLILLAVAGAFALFQFGGSALVRMATPQGHFEPPPPQSGPDYAKLDSWLARPGIEPSANPSLWRPANFPPPTLEARKAQVFFIHPTTYLERDRWNAPLKLTGEAATRANLFVQSQSSAFASVGEIWAPRYRQAAYGAFLLDNRDARSALDLAYRDVAQAFDRFIAEVPAGAPLILAGHSQGSLHLLRLLAERRDALAGRLVAAYVVGWPVSSAADLPATGLAACRAPDQAGCLLSWQSFGDPANPALVTGAWVGSAGLTGARRQRRDMVCVDPISGRSGGASPAADNPGTLVANGDLTAATLAPGQVGAACRDGFLTIGGRIPNYGPYVLPGNNYHVYDYALFWGAVRADAERRMAAWLAR